MKVKREIKEKYNKQYVKGADEWRNIGGKGKAINIINIADGSKKTKVLDVGSGEGSVLYWLDFYKFSKNITSLEISSSGIQAIKARNLVSIKQIYPFDGYSIPFENDSFDLALCSHVIEHVEFPRRLIREISRVSKEQIFEVPIDFSLNVDKKVNYFLNYGHINIYTPHTFRFLLQSEGLEIVSYQNSLYDEKVFKYHERKLKKIVKLKNKLKRSLWKNIPFLMNLKPNVTTVKTRKSKNPIEIMN